MLLLSKFGGTWVDGSVYPMEHVVSILCKILNDTGFLRIELMYIQRKIV